MAIAGSRKSDVFSDLMAPPSTKKANDSMRALRTREENL